MRILGQTLYRHTQTGSVQQTYPTQHHSISPVSETKIDYKWPFSRYICHVFLSKLHVDVDLGHGNCSKVYSPSQ